MLLKTCDEQMHREKHYTHKLTQIIRSAHIEKTNNGMTVKHNGVNTSLNN